ncbi:MAG: methyltransferase domain-containing protein [Lactobacillus sp.]|nr:methyltransferase domain-containing protein [Lactobacillus sp.]
MKKIERGAQFVAQNLQLFCCPVCQADFTKVVEHSVFCAHKHQFDLSKKGTLYLIKHGVTSDYDDDEMWQARRILLQAGLFDPIIHAIIAQMDQPTNANILDIGCGEGSVLHRLEELRQNKTESYVGFDISKRAINLATQQETTGFFCVADLAALPFRDKSFDYLIDIFSPSAYHEFKRVQTDQGKLLKIIPNANYLGELRRALYDKNDEKHAYSNQKVLDLFYQHYPEAKTQRISYEFELTPKLFENLLKMTPLQWGASKARLQEVAQKGLTKISVDVTLLVGEK